MVRVAIVKLGHIKHHVDFGKIVRWRSALFQITGVNSRLDLPDGMERWQFFSDDRLGFVAPVNGADLTVAITEYALEDNFYMRRLQDSVVAMSLYETAEIIESANIPLELFVLRNIYELCLLHHLCDSLPATAEGIPDTIHDETRSCLFDMNGLKEDIVYSTAHPSFCSQCHARLAATQLPDGIVAEVEKELRRIRKPLYHRIADWVKLHPILAMGITFATAMVIELLGNSVYDMLKGLFGGPPN
jgi:hypothetical protein